MRANKGATTKALSTRDAYMQYQMEMQSAGIEALPYEAWIQQQAEMAKQQKQ
jgi:hypothetical protein